jgi:hypothetical protein
MRSELSFALALALVSFARPAFADPPASPEHDAAFRSGLDQYAHGNNVGAIATWESLLGTLGEERGYKVLYNLGLAYQAIGDVTRAIERFSAFVKQVGARSDVPRELAERAADAQSRLEQLERAYGAVDVHAPTHGGLVLTRIGTSEPRAAGYVVWLAPGHHDLELYVGTDHVKKVRLDVVQGKKLDVDTSEPEGAATSGAPATAPSAARPTDAGARSGERSRDDTWIWIGAGATVVSCAVPLTFFALASGAHSHAESLGPGSRDYAGARDTFGTWRTLQYVSYALPIGLGLATLGYVIFRPKVPANTALRALERAAISF